MVLIAVILSLIFRASLLWLNTPIVRGKACMKGKPCGPDVTEGQGSVGVGIRVFLFPPSRMTRTLWYIERRVMRVKSLQSNEGHWPVSGGL